MDFSSVFWLCSVSGGIHCTVGPWSSACTLCTVLLVNWDVWPQYVFGSAHTVRVTVMTVYEQMHDPELYKNVQILLDDWCLADCWVKMQVIWFLGSQSKHAWQEGSVTHILLSSACLLLPATIDVWAHNKRRFDDRNREKIMVIKRKEKKSTENEGKIVITALSWYKLYTFEELGNINLSFAFVS